MDTIIRPATAADAVMLLALFKQHAQFEGQDLQIKDQKQQLLQLENLKVAIFIIEHNSIIVGYFSLLPQYSTWDMSHYLYLDCLYIDEESRGLGIGKVAIRYIQQFAKDNNLTLIQWQTPSNNDKAIAFYRHIGATDKAKARFFLSATG